MSQSAPGQPIDPEAPLVRRRTVRLSAAMDARIQELAAEWDHDVGEVMRYMLDIADLVIRDLGVHGPHWPGAADVVADMPPTTAPSH